MSKNVYKFNQVIVQGDDTLVIDNNEKVARKIEYLEELMLREAKQEENIDTLSGFTSGLDAAQVDALTMDEEDPVVFKSDSAAPINAAEDADALGVISAQANEMLSEARKEADTIKIRAIEEVQMEIEDLKQKVYEESREQGYAAGYNEALAHIESQQKSLEAERERLDIEYQELVNELEPKFVEALTDIYEKVFKIDLAKERSIVMHLISTAMHKIEGSSNYLVHVSKEDYPYVIMKKEEVLSGVSFGNASVEVVEDMTLGANACIIETDGGVFDCGLGTQLEELSQKLKLLSYTRER